MIHLIVFNLLQLGCSGYAIWRGGKPEKIVGASLLAAYAATVASYSALETRFHGVETGPFAVDVALLLVLTGVALYADRFWPLLIAALQFDTVFAHVMKMAEIEMIRVTYAVMIAIWSYPMATILAIGTYRHRRRLARRGHDRDWSGPRRRRAPFWRDSSLR